MPAADEVWALQNRKGPERDFFLRFSEEGHYGGRNHPTDTRQGIYCCSPGGRFLGSINSGDPRAVARMLTQALARWDALSEAERYLDPAPQPGATRALRGESRYPAGGLVLHVYSRDLPRAEGDGPRGWRAHAWNKDFAWFTRAEARRLFGAPEKDARHEVARELVARLARFHLVDNVFGQTQPYGRGDVAVARLQATVTEADAARVEIRFDGETRTEAEGRWALGGLRPLVADRTRGIETKLLGRATWDRKAQRFTVFELVATGTRWGGTRYNARDDDLAKAPIGFAFVLAGDTPAERVAPAFWWQYLR